ncbi:hypothetical protein KIW84_024670 [Lathyrus oleraceus]|uniref:Uncharacterized protein n=1 Tax=Pisum sativum TaxID=3888 RepID=A0A9D4YG74_PEA|nr:hypothetical protein KIW84_024670 [Pisum sativum]
MADNDSSNKFDTGKNPMAYTILPSENDEGRDFVHEPPMAKDRISNAAMSNSVWATFFTPTLLSTRIETGTSGFGFIGYQPNMVARQLGFI